MTLDSILKSLQSTRWQDEVSGLVRTAFNSGRGVADDAEARAGELRAAAAREIAALRLEAERRARLGKKEARHFADLAQRSFGALEDGALREVRANPRRALAIAAVSGILVALLASRV